MTALWRALSSMQTQSSAALARAQLPKPMNYEFLIIVIPIALVAGTVGLSYRCRFTVAEGNAGLLYRHGKFVEVLAAGRHARWGRGLTLTLQDLRKATAAVAGQEVLTADNVSLKASLLVT
jgi:regulator of protease activity HflC (stomatin/prohibitin superfamily)